MTPATRPLTYADAVRIRRAAAELAEQLPRIVTEQRDAGTPAARIAADLGLTESYVHRLARRHRAAEQ